MKSAGINRAHELTAPRIVLIILLIIFTNGTANSQQQEPQLLTNIPIGTNYLGLQYSYTSGNVLFDPFLPVKDLKADLNTIVASYIHTFKFLSKSSKVSIQLPWGYSNWDSYYERNNPSTWRMGMGDMRIQFSINLLGAPALKSEEYKDYKQKTIVGFSLLIVDPTGTYYSDKKINLSSNRWSCKPQIGLSHRSGKWFYEANLGLWLFGHNPNYYNGNRLTQKPIYTAKLHAIRSLKNNIWIGVGAGYGAGGQTAVNEIYQNLHIETLRFGAIVSFPIKNRHRLKLRYDAGLKIKEGGDFNSGALIYQYRWNKSEKKNTKPSGFYSVN